MRPLTSCGEHTIEPDVDTLGAGSERCARRVFSSEHVPNAMAIVSKRSFMSAGTREHAISS